MQVRRNGFQATSAIGVLRGKCHAPLSTISRLTSKGTYHGGLLPLSDARPLLRRGDGADDSCASGEQPRVVAAGRMAQAYQSGFITDPARINAATAMHQPVIANRRCEERKNGPAKNRNAHETNAAIPIGYKTPVGYRPTMRTITA